MRDKMLQLPINISFFLALDQRDYKKWIKCHSYH